MSTFSSVVRKPGQKIQPKAPRRNVQRNPARHVAPPSLTPESLTVSPAVGPIDKVAQSQEPESQPEVTLTVHDTNEITSIAPSVVPSIAQSIEGARETLDRPSPNAEAATTWIPSLSVEVTVPSNTSHGIQIIHPPGINSSDIRARQDGIPTISISTPSSTGQKRRATNEPTPAPSEGSVQERDAAESARKRQKTMHITEDVEESEPQSPPPSDTTHSVLRRSPRARRSESRTSDALLQDATSQAAAVSELANDIENRARSLRTGSERRSMSLAVETEDSTAEESAQSQPKRSRKKKSKSKRIQELAQQVVEDAVRGSKDKNGKEDRRRSRLATPENAEELEIDPLEVSMSELTKDIKIGRKSETEKRMQENWADIKKRRKEEVEKRREAARGKNNPLTIEEDRDGAEEAAVPKQIIVNGQIVVANESREVAFGAGVEQAARENADVAIEDDRIYKNVNQGTLGKNAGRQKRSSWDEDQTNLFYQGLRMFGTDFSMIANLFPESIDRRMIKKKYLLELETDPERVDKCVTAKETVSLEDYAAMTNMEFEDPEKLMKELEEEERRLREEDEKRKADQGYVMNNEGADFPLPSTERDVGEEAAGGAGEGEEQDTAANEGTVTPAPTKRTQAPSTARSDRINALAERVVQAAVAPKKRQQRRTRESTRVGRGGRGGKKGRRVIEGVEERIGPIDEVEL